MRQTWGLCGETESFASLPHLPRVPVPLGSEVFSFISIPSVQHLSFRGRRGGKGWSISKSPTEDFFFFPFCLTSTSPHPHEIQKKG